jgi:hypothetical protein
MHVRVVVDERRVGGLPAVLEHVRQFEVGPFSAELRERESGGDQVGGADLEEVREQGTAFVRVGQVEAALAEFLGEVVVHVDRHPGSTVAAELVGDGVAAGAEPLADVADAVDRRVVSRQHAAE